MELLIIGEASVTVNFPNRHGKLCKRYIIVNRPQWKQYIYKLFQNYASSSVTFEKLGSQQVPC